jgi:hypothetical protein
LNRVQLQARTGLAGRTFHADLRRQNRNWNFAAANHTGYSNNHACRPKWNGRYSSGLAYQVTLHVLARNEHVPMRRVLSGNGRHQRHGRRQLGAGEHHVIGAPAMTSTSA